MKPHHQEYFYKPINEFLNRVLPNPVFWNMAFKITLVALIAYLLIG